MSDFLTVDHPDAFVDFPLREKPVDEYKKHVCPLCKGHGGWNLQLNAYQLHGRENTPDNRHKFSHFIQCCIQCDGWGWVNERDLACVHNFEYVRTLSHCYSLYRCIKCDLTTIFDSSD